MLNITGTRRTKHRTLELNMAPLIDMIFILLIFFLVTTSFVKESGVDINRPTASTAVTKEKASIFIGISRANRIYLEKREIDTRAVRANVERALAENPDASIVIVADKESLTGTAIQVLDECRMAGAKNVSIAARLPSGN
jgi:biopolymer transport protein ExbD